MQKISIAKEFRTPRIILRPVEMNDMEKMLPLTQNPEMWKWFTSNLSDKNELKKWVANAYNDKDRLSLTMLNAQTNELIGSTSIGNISYLNQRAEIGWTWITKSFRGKLFNEASKFVLMHFLFEDCKFERVECKTDVLNLPARRALVRMGFREEGVLRSHTLMTGGRRRDTIFYSVLKDEWPEVADLLGTKLKNASL